MKKYKSGAPFGFSLPRRLLALFLIFVLVLYAVGMAVAIHSSFIKASIAVPQCSPP